VIRALSENQGLIDFGLVPRALLGLLALLCGNGYIVGINQARARTLRRERNADHKKGHARAPGRLRVRPRRGDTATQIYDISIDKVNKPFLPVASGEMTVKFAWIAVRTLAGWMVVSVVTTLSRTRTHLCCNAASHASTLLRPAARRCWRSLWAAPPSLPPTSGSSSRHAPVNNAPPAVHFWASPDAQWRARRGCTRLVCAWARSTACRPSA
jgi:hypothetical protein